MEENENKFSKEVSAMEIREDVHAGIWYTKRKNELETQLNCWMDLTKIEIKNIKALRAIIAPHSGFAFSGLTASWAYKYFKPIENLRIFVLGPCHHLYLRSCGLSSMKQYKTPLGNIDIDIETIKAMHEEGEFESVDKDAEEDEHSIEMQLPFIKKLMGGLNFKIVPVYVGSLDLKAHQIYGEVFKKYLEDKNSFFVISSDLTHWGAKWNFTYYNHEDGEIFECIEKIDRKFMEIVETQNPLSMLKFLEETEVHICGKHAILIFYHALNSILYKNSNIYTKFVKYSQTFPIKDKKDSSISFGAAIIFSQD